MVVGPVGFHLLWILWLAPVVIGFVVLLVWALGGFRHPPQWAPPPPPGSPGPPGPPTAPRETPLDILQRRFAAGEINAEEYQKARDLLRDEPPTGR